MNTAVVALSLVLGPTVTGTVPATPRGPMPTGEQRALVEGVEVWGQGRLAGPGIPEQGSAEAGCSWGWGRSGAHGRPQGPGMRGVGGTRALALKFTSTTPPEDLSLEWACT